MDFSTRWWILPSCIIGVNTLKGSWVFIFTDLVFSNYFVFSVRVCVGFWPVSGSVFVVAILIFAVWLVAQNSSSCSDDHENDGSNKHGTPPTLPQNRSSVSIRTSKRCKKKTTKGFKSCPSCRYNFSLTDPHRYCLIGTRKHDMATCEFCLSLGRK